MITKYRILDNLDNELDIVNTIEEADQYIQTMRDVKPHLELRYESFEVSTVKGLGRDPDLH
jgi:hypothetical protein|tara:strand:- start:255 stop:437 length:183 start_codon:yes stop_codon:yes gene_type:complete